MMSGGDGSTDDTPQLTQTPVPFCAASPCLPVSAAAVPGGGRNPRCARCSNHGVSVPLKGHKAYCAYRRCECDKCQLVVLRRTIMAQQVAWRRRQDLDRLRQQQQLMTQQKKTSMISKRCRIISQNDTDEPDGAGSSVTAESSYCSEHREVLQSSLVVKAGDVGGPVDVSRSETTGDDETCEVGGGASTAPIISSSSTDAGSLSTLAMIILSYNKNDPRLAIDNVRQVEAELWQLRNETSASCNLDALANSLQVTAAGPRGGFTGASVVTSSSSSSSTSLLLPPPSLCTPPVEPLSLFVPSASRAHTTVPTPFGLFQPYVGAARSILLPPPVHCQPGFSVVGRLASASAVGDTLLSGRLGPEVPTAPPPPPIPGAYLPPLGGADTAAAIWTKHWQKSRESSTTMVHPFAAASALW